MIQPDLNPLDSKPLRFVDFGPPVSTAVSSIKMAWLSGTKDFKCGNCQLLDYHVKGWGRNLLTRETPTPFLHPRDGPWYGEGIWDPVMKVEGELRSNKVGPYQFNSHASIWSQLCCWEAYPRKKNTHNVTILLTEDILNQFGKSFIYPIISHDSHRFFFKNIPRGADSINNTTLLQYAVEFVDETWETPHTSRIRGVFLFSCFFSGTILKFEHLKDFLWFRWSSRSTFTFPGLLPGIKVHWNFGGVLGGKTPWLINLFFLNKYTV